MKPALFAIAVLLAGEMALSPAPPSAPMPAPGQFLVASRGLPDPNFARAVVLMLQVDEHTAMGLVVNRRSSIPLSRALQKLPEAGGRTDFVYLGGPVELDAVLALLRSQTKPDGARQVLDGVYLISRVDVLKKVLGGKPDSGAFRAYAGYAGWTADQLRGELRLGAWRVIPAEAGSVFDSDPQSVWPRAIRRAEAVLAFDSGRGRFRPPLEVVRGGPQPVLDPVARDTELQ